jgi:hypothetical protein
MLSSRRQATPGKKAKKGFTTPSPRIRKASRLDTPDLKRLKSDIYDINSVISFGRVEIKPLEHNDIVVPKWAMRDPLVPANASEVDAEIEVCTLCLSFSSRLQLLSP